MTAPTIDIDTTEETEPTNPDDYQHAFCAPCNGKENAMELLGLWVTSFCGAKIVFWFGVGAGLPICEFCKTIYESGSCIVHGGHQEGKWQ